MLGIHGGDAARGKVRVGLGVVLRAGAAVGILGLGAAVLRHGAPEEVNVVDGHVRVRELEHGGQMARTVLHLLGAARARRLANRERAACAAHVLFRSCQISCRAKRGRAAAHRSLGMPAASYARTSVPVLP